MTWAAPTARLWIVGVASLVSFAVGFAAAWNWQGSRGEAALQSRENDYNAALIAAQVEAAKARQALNAAARRQEERYEQAIHEIRAEADSRPPRVIRVRVCDLPPGAAGSDSAGGAAVTADTAADAGGVGSDAGAGARTVDLSGLDRVIDEAKRVSARLVALQGACG